MNLKKVFFIFLRISISILLLIILFKQIHIKDIFWIFKHTKLYILLFSFFIFLLGYLIGFFRWQMLLKALSIKVSLKRLFVSFCGGIFFNLFFPSTIGGDLVRTLDLATHTQRSKEVLATVILDRLSGYIGLVIVVLGATLFGLRFIKNKNVFILVSIIVLILISILLVLFNNSIYSRVIRFLANLRGLPDYLKNLYEQIHDFRYQHKVILNNLLLSTVIQLMGPLIFYLIGLSLGINIKPIYFFIFIPIISVITLIPISIGGLGLRELSTLYFFAQLGLNKHIIFASALISSFFTFVISVIGGLIYVFSLYYRRI